MSVVALVPAAGSGARLAADRPKAFVALAGVPLVLRAVRGLFASGVVDHVVVAVPAAEREHASTMLDECATVVVGAAERSGSVRIALHDAVRRHPELDVVLVHDAARALTPSEVIRDVVSAVRSGWPAVVPVLPLADTVKSVDAAGRVTETHDRAWLRAVQTPQAFAADLLRRAYAAETAETPAVTDDAALVERLGVPVHTVRGHPLAFKITTREDFDVAERLVQT